MKTRKESWKPTPCIHNQISQLCPHCEKPQPTHTPKRKEPRWKYLLRAAKALYDDANDRGETHGDDGTEYDDWRALRIGIEKVEGK